MCHNPSVKYLICVATVFMLTHTSAWADDWDRFYNRYPQKYFVVSFQQQDHFTSGAVGPPLKREWGIAVTSPDTVRKIFRQENTVTGQVTRPGEVTVRKGSSSSVTATERVTVEISGNRIISAHSVNGTASLDFVVTVSGNSCSGKFTSYQYNGRIVHPKRTKISCKVVSAN